MRPASIVRFERLYLGAVGVGLIGLALSWNGVIAAVRARPDIAQMGVGFVIAGLVLAYVAMLALWYFAAHRRSVIAKWVTSAWFVYSTVALALTIFQLGLRFDLVTVIGWLSYLLRAWSVSYLFKPDADAWFASKR